MDTKVSIIIPTFNYGDFLPETIKSLQDQTHQNWEAIFVDDGSTDNTEQSIAPFLLKDERLRYIKQENQGVSVARNRGLKEATGEFIQFLDADDLLSPSKLKSQLQYHQENPDTLISYTDCFYFRSDNKLELFPDFDLKGKEWMVKLKGDKFELIEGLVKSNIVVISSPMLHKSVLDKVTGFQADWKHSEDWHFWASLAFNEIPFHYITDPNAYTLIRVHQKSVSSNRLNMTFGEIRFRNYIHNKIEEADFLNLSEKKKLIKSNNHVKTELLKYCMYHGPMHDLQHLSKLVEYSSVSTVFKLYLKGLNYKRKSLFKKLS